MSELEHAMHAASEEAPGSGFLVPDWHGVALDSPVEAQTFPAGHCVHCAEAERVASMYVPALQRF